MRGEGEETKKGGGVRGTAGVGAVEGAWKVKVAGGIAAAGRMSKRSS